MPDLRTLLRAVDSVETRDRWDEIIRRRDAPLPLSPSPFRRVAIAGLALLVAALSFILVVRAWQGREKVAISPNPTIPFAVSNGPIYFRSQIRSGVPTSWEAIFPDGTGLHTIFPASGS